MGKITETHVGVAIVTMVIMNVSTETNILWCTDVGWWWLIVRLHTVGEVWYKRLPCLFSYLHSFLHASLQ